LCRSWPERNEGIDPLTHDKLFDAYHVAMGAYEAAKAGTGCRIETFATFLVAEKVLTARFRLG
jgi:hypothetical protein